jgi:hypothetical protein
VKLSEGPIQLIPPFVKVGIIITVAEEGEMLLLTAVNDGILPLPLAASPIVLFELVQE